MASSSPRLQSEDLRRRPIHGKDVDEEEEDNDDEIDIENSVAASQKKGLYPDIQEIARETGCILESTRCVDVSIKRSAKFYKDGNLRELSEDKKFSYKETNNSKWCVILAILFVLICIFFGFTVWKLRASHSSRLTHSKQTYEKVVFILRENFRSQSDLSMKVINSSLWPVVPEDAKPKRPAVIVLTSSDESAPVAECLAKKIASSLAGDEYVHIDGGKYTGEDPNEVKEEIDYVINQQFKNDKLNVGVISRLDKIPADAAMIFHGFCDDSYAHFPKAVYVMTVATSEAIPKDINYNIMDKIASNRLEEAWGRDLHADQLMPLLARLTPSATVVFPENALPDDCSN